MTEQIDSQWQPGDDLLASRVILVTGAAEGIGRAAALGFASYGATVVLLDKVVSKLEKVYDDIESAGYPAPAIYPLNLESAGYGDYEEMSTRILGQLGQLNGILHNAAIAGPLAPLDHYDIKLWYQTMQVNLNAPFLLTRACLPALRQADDAAILFVSDRCGRQGKAYWGAYGVAKWGLEGLAQTLADELEQNTRIRVNTIDPGPARTRMRAAAYPAENPADLPEPETLMHPFLFLIGPDSEGITGRQFDAQ